MASEQGSQPKTVVALATATLALMTLGATYLLVDGPVRGSAFFFFRLPVFFYPLAAPSVLGLGYGTYLGVKRLKSMWGTRRCRGAAWRSVGPVVCPDRLGRVLGG